jgi:hypothetical protein
MRYDKPEDFMPVASSSEDALYNKLKYRTYQGRVTYTRPTGYPMSGFRLEAYVCNSIGEYFGKSCTDNGLYFSWCAKLLKIEFTDRPTYMFEHVYEIWAVEK